MLPAIAWPGVSDRKTRRMAAGLPKMAIRAKVRKNLCINKNSAMVLLKALVAKGHLSRRIALKHISDAALDLQE